MAYTPENNPYIPGDPYSYDLKWIVKKIKELVSAYGKIATLEKDFEDLKAFVLEYFENADFKQLVSDKLDEMLENGDLQELVESLLVHTVKYYNTLGELMTSDAEIGANVVYNNEIYKISETDNGYGIGTVNGFAVRDFTKLNQLSYDAEKVYKFYLFGALSGSVLQGSCRAEALGETAYCFRYETDQAQNKIVFIKDDGTRRETVCANMNLNDITYIDSLNMYCAIESFTVGYNFVLIDTAGSIVQHVAPSSSAWYAANIAYDKKHDRLISWVAGELVAIYKPIVDNGAFMLITTIERSGEDYTLPNEYPYTARQGSCCDDEGDFYTVSSIFYNDDYRKPVARVCQVNTITGEIIAYNDFEYAYQGVEAESIFIENGALKINGYVGRSGGIVCQIIAPINQIVKKPNTALTSVIYYDAANGKMTNSGNAPDDAVNDLWLACSIAGSYEKGTVFMITDEPNSNYGSIDLVFKKSLIITSGTSTKHNIYSRFYIQNMDGYFELQYAILRQNSTNKIVQAINTNCQIVIYNSQIVGSGNNQGRYIVLMTDGGQISMRTLEVSNCYALANIARGVYMSACEIAATNSNRIVDADEGALAVIDTTYKPCTGFGRYGEQFGGLILKGIRQDVPM